MKMKLLSAVPLFLWSCLVYNVQQSCAQHHHPTPENALSPVSESGSVPTQSSLKTPDRQAERASSDAARSLPGHQVLPSVQELVAITDELQKKVLELTNNQVQELVAITDELQKKVLELTNNQGSTYVRWGRTMCPIGSTLLYTGYGAGDRDSNIGGGSNRLCMTKKPVFDHVHIKISSKIGELFGLEYYVPGHYSTYVVCTLCRNSYSSTFMVSGTNRCPFGSVLQYHGYLTSNYKHNIGGRSEYLCLDRFVQERPYTKINQARGYMELVLIGCGVLPCPPYVKGAVTLCAVCSV